MGMLKSIGKAVAVGSAALLGANLAALGISKVAKAPDLVKTAVPYVGAGAGAYVAAKILGVGL